MGSDDKQKVVAIMRSTPHAFLATLDGDQPRVRPVSPIVTDDLSIYITTSSASAKVRQIRQNPRISLAFLQSPNGDTDANVIGKCEIITGMAEKKKIWDLVASDLKLTEHFPNGLASDDFCLLRVLIKKVEWRESNVSKVDIHVYRPPQK